jgi:hypothetical protein
MDEEIENKTPGVPETALAEEPLIDEPDVRAHPGWREIFRQAFDRARRDERVMNRRELGRDRSRSLFLLGGAAIAVLLLFLGVFSSSDTTRKPADARRPVTPDLGHRVTPGLSAAGQPGSVTPLLDAQPGQVEDQNNQNVTSEDVDRTARPAQPFVASQPKSVATPVAGPVGPYALEKIDFSDTPTRQQAPGSASSQVRRASEDFGKPSLVFVRSVPSSAASTNAGSASAARADSRATLDLPAGTRLVARLESAVTSAIKAPVAAAIEYNYERAGEIVVPAGAEALGSLEQADRSGYVAIRFDTIQMPDGTTEKIDATAMSLIFGPLKGAVSGKRTGTNFLVRAFTGLGQAATYLAGSGGLNAPLSQSAFLRDRIATNVGIAGDEELNGLAFNQNLVVTVPANTRFYLVVEKGAAMREGETRTAATEQANHTPLPSAEELRQLIELRRELSEVGQQPSVPGTAQQAPQQ